MQIGGRMESGSVLYSAPVRWMARRLIGLCVRRSQWEEVATLQSHRASMPTISKTQEGMPSPYAQLAISLGVYLGHCFPPPASAGSSSSTEPEEIPPADMKAFGFANVGEVLDLCAAVRLTLPFVVRHSVTLTDLNSILTLFATVHDQHLYAVISFPHAHRRLNLSHGRSLQPLLLA